MLNAANIAQSFQCPQTRLCKYITPERFVSPQVKQYGVIKHLPGIQMMGQDEAE